MSEMYRKLTPGQRVRSVNAQLHNDTIDVVRSVKAEMHAQGAIDTVPAKAVRILNDRGAYLGRYSIVGIGNPITLPVVNEGEFYEKIGFVSAAPGAASPFAIMQEGIQDGTIGFALMTGESHALVNLTSTSHSCASPSSADYDKLLSGSTGTARILYRGIPAATQLNGAINDVVTSLVVDATKGWTVENGNFVVTIDSERLQVTAVSGTTWTVSRGHGGTTPASHADNASVVFYSGVVPCVVQIGITGNAIVDEWSTTTDGILTTGTQTGAGDKTTTGSWNVANVGGEINVVIVSSCPQVVLTDDTANIGTVIVGDDSLGPAGNNDSIRIEHHFTSGGDKYAALSIDATIGRAILYCRASGGGYSATLPAYAVVDASGSLIEGLWDTVSGLEFSGGLYTGGSLDVDSLTYTPATSSNWGSSPPATIVDAIDLVSTIVNAYIPTNAPKSYSVPGSYDRIISTDGNYEIKCYGGGGGGGGGSAGTGGDGGGGGEYASETVALRVGDVITIVVGDGGAGGTAGNSGVGGTQSSVASRSGSSFTTVSANGGSGGAPAGAGTGGQGGTGSTNTTHTDGGNGATGNGTNGGTGGTTGVYSGASGGTGSSSGSASSFVSGGGGGGPTNGVGGAGGAGVVTVTKV